ncbi:MAG: D-alanyl-D-alanine carboxypeptidase, partial [Lachnospiraceae bacterium]|nr:D-alanyl-D-alanine carboxypeptidase [Lachnospiraceae bacterium]
MKNYIVYLLVMIVVICGCPVPSSAAEEPKLYAKAAVLMDADTGRVLYGRAPDEALPMASTTKIMTLILALEYGNPDDVVTVSSYAAKMPEVRLGLHAGDRYVLQDLLYSMMLESHNDSACAVAEQVGGSVEAFAQMMNRKAAEIGLHDTYFITPNGLDAEDAVGVHSTTAEDLAKLMRYCVFVSEEKEEFQEICQTRQYTFASCDGTRQFTVYNKNALLDQMDGVLAGKTGFTGNAGYCYVAAVNVGEKHFIVALL